MRMEEFGFFDTVQEHLPEGFTLIYEIARILEDQQHAMARALAPVLMLEDTSVVERDRSHVVPTIIDAEQYEADLIRSVTEVQQIYPYQFLLPENVFLQRLAERSLWMPRPHAPHNFRYQTESDRFAPDDRKQKVYILFDTSSSMRQHYRIHLAKAIAYLFLKQNQRELGTIFFRTFDLSIGELKTARNVADYDWLISDVMHLTSLGNGTVLQKALQTALEDISHESQLSQAQILVITDGVAHIDPDSLKELMGEHTIVNTVKIGHSRMHIDSKIIEDQIYHSKSAEAARMKELIRQKRDVESDLSRASGHMRQESLRSQISLIQRQIDTLTERIAGEVTEHYGMEIRRLSSVYVEVDDIPAPELFSFPEAKVAELEQLASDLLDVLRDEHQVEDIKRAAILYDHLYLLMEYNKTDAPRLERYAKDLEQMLDHILNKPGTAAEDVSISDMERLQLRNMMEGGVSAQAFSLGRLLRVLRMRLTRRLRAWQQLRLLRIITGKDGRRR